MDGVHSGEVPNGAGWGGGGLRRAGKESSCPEAASPAGKRDLLSAESQATRGAPKPRAALPSGALNADRDVRAWGMERAAGAKSPRPLFSGP